MKIEKLTENKIRIILSTEDLKKNNVDFKSFVTNSSQSQDLLLTILNRAEQEIGFYTKDSKILIEAFASSDEQIVFTITKFSPENVQTISPKKTLTVKRRDLPLNNKIAIYSFANFDSFCDFCDNLTINLLKNMKNFCKNISLYLYNDTYYLILSDINTNCEFLKCFYSSISEFATFITDSSNFKHKLLEHGKPIFKNNAILSGYRFFGTI
ncbi:MAG: adaptor protein MecA [Clostridia bacterium]|nr:adaptor protein MecA [Clostridia bacterium]